MSQKSTPGVRLLQESDVPYEQTARGLDIARSITAAGFTELGGGWVRMDGSGELEIVSDGRSTVAQPGEAILIGQGTTVTYRAKPGTRVFFVLYPRDWGETTG